MPLVPFCGLVIGLENHFSPYSWGLWFPSLKAKEKSGCLVQRLLLNSLLLPPVHPFRIWEREVSIKQPYWVELALPLPRSGLSLPLYQLEKMSRNEYDPCWSSWWLHKVPGPGPVEAWICGATSPTAQISRKHVFNKSLKTNYYYCSVENP